MSQYGELVNEYKFKVRKLKNTDTGTAIWKVISEPFNEKFCISGETEQDIREKLVDLMIADTSNKHNKDKNSLKAFWPSRIWTVRIRDTNKIVQSDDEDEDLFVGNIFD